MINNTNIALVALILYIACLISIPFQIKKYGRRDIEGPKGKFWARQTGIFVFALAIIVLCFFMSFGAAGNIALCACGVLGCYIATKEFADHPDDAE